MKKNRVNYFIFYSFSFIFIVLLFSTTIYLSIKYNEHERISYKLYSSSQAIQKKVGNGITEDELYKYSFDNQLFIVFWENDEMLIDIPRISSQFTTKIAPQEEKNVVETISIPIKQNISANTTKNQQVTLSMITTPLFLNNKIVQLQVISYSQDSENILKSLRIILFLGSLIIIIFGVSLSLLLSKINVKPIYSAWQKQREFVADASHELRTPISIISLKIDKLLGVSDQKIIDNVEDIVTIQQENRRMQRLVNDLLFLAKNDSGVVALQKSFFNALDLLNELDILYSDFFQAEEKHLILEDKVKNLLYADYQKILQVCMIIIDNALAFTEKNNFVKVTIEEKSGKYFFKICNNGIPLPEKTEELIFERFYKHDRSRTKKEASQSSGLGLSIAREIIYLHHGKIKAMVTKEKHTCFTFFLPMQKSKNE